MNLKLYIYWLAVCWKLGAFRLEWCPGYRLKHDWSFHVVCGGWGLMAVWNSRFILFFSYHNDARSKTHQTHTFLGGQQPPQWARAPSFTRFLDHTQRHTTVGRTPLDEWSARHGYLYLTTHNTHNRQPSMPTAGFEPTISASRAAADRRLTQRGHLDRQITRTLGKKNEKFTNRLFLYTRD